MINRKRTTTSKSRTGPVGKHLLDSPLVTVLHVDDDPNDTELLRAAARKAEVRFLLHNVEDADQAIAYLTGRGLYADRKKYQVPALILLDLKMPRTNGFEVLQWIRQHPEIGQVPVIILSGSELQDDMKQAYASGANSYIVKPLGFEALVQLVKDINLSWLASLCAIHQAGISAEL